MLDEKISFYPNVFLFQYCVEKGLVCISPKTNKFFQFFETVGAFHLMRQFLVVLDSILEQEGNIINQVFDKKKTTITFDLMELIL